MDTLRVGRVLRALRHRLGWRQADVARAAGLTQDDVSRAERGRMRDVAKLKRHGAALEADVSIYIRWRGGEIDRLLDEGHAALVGWAIELLAGVGWECHPEVSFAVRGERGSVDVLAWHERSRTLLVVEVKTELASLEETLRRLDSKQRLARSVAGERFGWWRPAAVCRLLVLPGLTTARRQVARHSTVLDRSHPLRGDAARSWLRSPAGAASMLLFAPLTRGARVRRDSASRRRIRRKGASTEASAYRDGYAPEA